MHQFVTDAATNDSDVFDDDDVIIKKKIKNLKQGRKKGAKSYKNKNKKQQKNLSNTRFMGQHIKGSQHGTTAASQNEIEKNMTGYNCM